MNAQQRARLSLIAYQIEGIAKSLDMLFDGVELERREGFEVWSAQEHLESALRHARKASYPPETATTEGGE